MLQIFARSVSRFRVFRMAKTAGVVVLSGGALLALIAGGITWHEMTPARRDVILGNSSHFLGWTLLVAIVPWAAMFLVGRVAKMDSNPAAATLIVTMTALEAIMLAWLFGFSIGGATPWTFFIAAVLIAGVYNLLACDWIAERFD